MLKLFLYPLIILAVIVSNTLYCVALTWFFSIVFNVTMEEVANSPMVLLYIVAGVATMYMIVVSCCYINDRN